MREKFSTGAVIKTPANSNETEAIKSVTDSRESTSSLESVFATSMTIESLTSSSNISACFSESPRKRALSEDVSQVMPENQYKSFKPEHQSQCFREFSKSESSATPTTVGSRRRDSASKDTTSLEPSRKIKDIAAFFEKKQF